MKLTIEINMDNVAFDGYGNRNYEIKELLETIRVSMFLTGVTNEEAIALRDTNGNTVGFAKIEEG